MSSVDDPLQLQLGASSLLFTGIAQSTQGSVFVPQGGGEVEISGSPTEKAILSWAVKLGMQYDVIRSQTKVLHVFPFDSAKKRGGVAVKENSGVNIYWKGAAEIVLASCTRFYDSDGQLQSLDGKKEIFRKIIDEMAANSLRCVAIAYRDCDLDKVPSDDECLDKWQLPEDKLILLAIVGIKDPCRPSVKDAVRACTNAGIKVRMVTGDSIQTAKAIALECGILGPIDPISEPNIIEGRVFYAMSERERDEVAKKITVMGRSSPHDKLLLVQALRRGGDVAAVTGYRTNDAPALYEADIGLSMGIQGTEVAKQSSDIIILDDNFTSVVKVVRWGRSVYANIQKFILFQLPVIVAALVINVLAALLSGSSPLNAVELLWVNLINTLGALALATEPPTDQLMHRSLVGRRESIITNVMWRNLLVQATYQITILLTLNYAGHSLLQLNRYPTDYATTLKNSIIFNAFILMQLFNGFNARKPEEMNVLKGVTKNFLFMSVIGLTLVLQILIIEFLGKFFKTVRLEWSHWLLTVAISFVSWPLAMVGKLMPVPKTPL